MKLRRLVASARSRQDQGRQPGAWSEARASAGVRVVGATGGSATGDTRPSGDLSEVRRLVRRRHRSARRQRLEAARGSTCATAHDEVRSPRSRQPHPRADMLLSRADLVRRDGGARPRLRGRLVHRLAGRDHHRPRSHEGEDPRDHARARARGARPGTDRPRRRLSGLLARHDGRDDARTGRHRRDRSRAGRRARRVVRDLLGRRRRLHRRPADRPGRAQARHASRTRRCSRCRRPGRRC